MMVKKLLLAVTALSLLVSCGSLPSRVSSYTPEQRYLFPFDMSQWGCQEYFERMKQNGTYATLVEMLKIRPHKYYNEANHKHLKLVPNDQTPEERADEPHFYHKVHQSVYRDMMNLLKAAREAGHDLRIQSAFRTVSLQNRLWEIAMEKHDFAPEIAAFKSAPPCFSEHATGKAIDISLPSIDDKLVESPAFEWLQDNAKKFGWIQSFKEGEKGVTRDPKADGISVEEWHWRHKSLKEGTSSLK